MKKSKLILSIAAVVFAVAGALATSAASVRMNEVPVADENDSECEPIGRCDTNGANPSCENVGLRFIIGGTCDDPATGQWVD